MRRVELFAEVPDQLPEHLADRYRNHGAVYWEKFYRRNATRFFKDRHWLDKIWPQLFESHVRTVLEVGCGVGNTVFPLLESNPRLTAYACDYSATAVKLVAEQAARSGACVRAFVADIAAPGALEAHVPEGSVDACTMVFVLSAVAPEHMGQALVHVTRCLRPGSGRLLFRDYAEGDLAQGRLAAKGEAHKRIGPGFYVRGDGTCCFYFTEAGLVALAAQAGLECESTEVEHRLVENRGSGVSMRRRFLHAVFVRSASAPLVPPPQSSPSPVADDANGDASPLASSHARAERRGRAPGAASAVPVSDPAHCRGSGDDSGGDVPSSSGQWRPWQAGHTQWELPPACKRPSAAAERLAHLLLQRPQLAASQCVLVCAPLDSALSGPAGALAALLAVRLGARRAVLALLHTAAPSGARGGEGDAGQQRALEGLAATLRRNSPRVVSERLRCVRVQLDDSSLGDGGGGVADGDDGAARAVRVLRRQALGGGYTSLVVATPLGPCSGAQAAAAQQQQQQQQQLLQLCQGVTAGGGAEHLVVLDADAGGSGAWLAGQQPHVCLAHHVHSL